MRETLQAWLVSAAGRALGPAAAPSGEPFSLWALVVKSSAEVKAVLFLLVGMAVVCWFVIGAKGVRIWRATRTSRSFLDRFWRPQDGPHWNAKRLEDLFGEVDRFTGSPLAAVFKAGYLELAKLGEVAAAGPSHDHVDNVERAMRRARDSELTGLETMLPFLATTGSTAPFIGLFGTVLGIIRTFMDLHGRKDASLDVVLPGIAEALIATAIGLLAAIPAVMAYNFFLRRIRVLEAEMDAFGTDYANIVRRYFVARR